MVDQSRANFMARPSFLYPSSRFDTALARSISRPWTPCVNRLGLRGYGQKDPLIEYKNEGYDMFLDNDDFDDAAYVSTSRSCSSPHEKKQPAVATG